MSLNLDSLFQQILDTQEQVQNRQARLVEVKKQNEVCLAEIRNCEVERRMYCDQVNIETKRLVEATVNGELAGNKLKVLSEQRVALEQRLESLRHQLESVEKELSASRENFAAEVNDFCKHYDLCSEHSHDAAPACQLMDDGAFNAQTRELADHVDQLQAALCAMRQKVEQKRLQQNQKTVDCLSNGVCRRQQLLLELQQQCDVEAASVIELQAEKSRVSLIPQTDPEYARLSAELQSSRDTCAANEALCSSLRHQLQQLQQSQWQVRATRRQQ